MDVEDAFLFRFLSISGSVGSGLGMDGLLVFSVLGSWYLALFSGVLAH